MVKKLIAVILLACIALTGCGGTKTLDVNAFGEKVMASMAFDDEMNPMPEDLLSQLYGIQDSDVKQKTVYVSTGYTPEEVVVMEAASAEAAARIETALKARVESQKEAFVNYIPEEMPKLNNPPIKRQGNYVAMIISGDDAAAAALIDEFFKG